ncbi:tetratricopeptide repeat protein [Desulfobacula phenolica]|uniref:Tetratricopeptide repeat-containing protein n=1 Tax=Desulfobacula phenolica TaxID=90732 RepID=A0A1H2ISI9_9BACT|nr:tetratricopeptide repeat protein [Desulfobacula phenolica]SDU46818.1 Tetratricopeptide repeat-containing protein [Desulfobacula phenolica]
MKQNPCFEWVLCIFMTLFMISCAQHRALEPPSTLPAENLPQIGTRQPASPRNTPRPAVLSKMIHTAENQLRSNKPEAAFQTLERALDIDGQDPIIWHLMAKAQQMQNNFQQAKYFAGKSNAMAARMPFLKKRNWRIIGDALKKQGRIQEAEAAYENAR